MMRKNARQIVMCSRCIATVDVGSPKGENWNVVYDEGRVVGNICPNCQTPEENAEAEVNAAVFDYSRKVTIDGVTLAPPKQ